jgi:hypothetical protein
MKAAGWRPVTLWMPKEILDSVIETASVRKIFRAHILRAALAVGLRHVRPSDIDAMSIRFRKITPGLPVGPPWPGAPYNPGRGWLTTARARKVNAIRWGKEKTA